MLTAETAVSRSWSALSAAIAAGPVATSGCWNAAFAGRAEVWGG